MTKPRAREERALVNPAYKENVMDLRSLVPFRGHGNQIAPEFTVFGSLQREVDRLFDDFARGIRSNGNTMLLPSIDVSETDKEIEVTVDLPGLERKDVDISLENDVLTIRGEKKIETKSDDKDRKDAKDKTYHVAERSYGVFYRVIQLPPGIDPSKVQATMSKGVLKVTIPKPIPSAAAKIEVKEAA
jgi:HSP20 family protein